MLDKIEVHEKLAKKVKQFNITTSVLSTGLITPTVNTRVASIAAFLRSDVCWDCVKWNCSTFFLATPIT